MTVHDLITIPSITTTAESGNFAGSARMASMVAVGAVGSPAELVALALP